MAFKNHKVQGGGGSGDLLKAESGKQYKFRVVGDAVVYNSEYKDNISTRYAMAVWNYTDGVANILQVPPSAFQQLVDLAESEWGEPTTYNLNYKKTGEGLETRHSFQPTPGKDEPTAEQLEEVKEIDLKAVLERFPSISHIFYLNEAENSQEAPEFLQPQSEEGKSALDAFKQ